MNYELNKYHDTRGDLILAVAAARNKFGVSVFLAQPHVSRKASVRALVRHARMSSVPAVRDALTEFERTVRPHLEAHWRAATRANRQVGPEAQFLIEHFDQFTEVPINASPVKRVVSWARRNYRAWRKADG